MGIYEKIGVRTIVNARGADTRIGGSLMPQEVLNAMAEASCHFMEITEVNCKVGEIITRVTGAEAGYVTAGAADGILLATAALMTGKDPAKIRQLPDISGLKSEVILHRSQLHGFVHQIRAAGAKLVEIGFPSPNCTFTWELEAAINESTAGVFYTKSWTRRYGLLSLPEVIRIAHGRGVPVFVDAAAMLPPPSSLREFIDMGSDLVIFSGGKGIMGPQSTGILCGRRDLVEAAALSGTPYQAVGRAAKVSKEEMIGLATALELFVQRDHQADQVRWRRQADYVANAISAQELPGVEAVVIFDPDEDQLPMTFITIREKVLGLSAAQVEDALYQGEPAIATGIPPSPNTVVINPHMLQDGEEEIVAHQLIEILNNNVRSAGAE